MSHKITAKNLAYDSSLPPFLARLRGQHASSGYADGPDPILAGQRRPGKVRSASAEAEDAPLVVDDAGNVVEGLSFGADGAVTGGEAARAAGTGGVGDAGDAAQDTANLRRENGEAKMAEEVDGIGGGKKRKTGKIIGQDRGDEGGGEDDTEKGIEGRPVKQRKRNEEASGKASKTGLSTDGKASGKTKKAKKVKLSFEDDEG